MTATVIPFPVKRAAYRAPQWIIDDVAETLVRLWSSGHRQPEISAITHDMHPGIGVETYNEAADLAWSIINQDNGGDT